jgi:hypothetical protein
VGFGVTDIFSTRDELHAGTRPVTITTTRANRNFKRASWPIIGALRKDLNREDGRTIGHGQFVIETSLSLQTDHSFTGRVWKVEH